MIDGEEVFNVLNDWFDLSQDAFEKVWPELREAFYNYANPPF